MTGKAKDDENVVKIKRPKPRVRTPLKTGTVVHKSPKTYTRKEKHKSELEEPGHD
jgi:hypothetical protein